MALVDDGAGIATALARRLTARGIETRVVAEVPPEASGAIVLSGLRELASVEDALAVNREVFLAARAMAPRLAAQGGVFVTVQDTSGDFGVSGRNAVRAWSAGLAGLAKTAALEWPLAGVVAIDVERGGREADAVAALLEEELLFGGPEPEVGLRLDGARVTLECVAEPAPADALRVDRSDVVVATGGARGVTAACLVELARQSRACIALLGRTELRDEPRACAGVSGEGALTRALVEARRAEDHTLTPAEVRAEVHAILAGREVRATLAALRAAGSDAEYFGCDVQDAAALARTLQEVRGRFGFVTVLVHGAGVLADKRIADKTPEQFDRVFGTKVRGLRALLDATHEDPLRAILLFSSVAARSGNAGQADYAMANEVLNKVAAAEAHRRGTSRIVRALGWGPWDGGMVTPALRARFAEAGVPVIPLAAGARMFVDELRGAAGPAEVLLGGAPRASGLAAASGPRERTLDFLVSAASHPFLDGHRVKGVPVLPVVLALEWFTRAARAFRPELALHAIRDLQVRRGVRLERFTAGELFRVACREPASGSDTWMTLELRGRDGTLHFLASAEMGTPGEAPAAPPAPALPGAAPPNLRAADLYRDVLFHGPAFQAIRTLEALGAAGAAADVAGVAELGWPGAYHTDAAALDAGLQLAIVWGHHHCGGHWLPTRIAGFVPYAEGPLRAPLRCVLTGREATPLRTLSDVALVTAAGRVVAELRGVEMHALPAPAEPPAAVAAEPVAR
jgi:NAD(P)-dependent dehydrogenase (short-subunit alcohol dehydrogenase family)